MALSRDDLIFLISALEALDSDWLAPDPPLENPAKHTITPRGLGLLHVAAMKVEAGMNVGVVRQELQADFAEMVRLDQLEKIEVQLLAMMLASRLREHLAKLVP